MRAAIIALLLAGCANQPYLAPPTLEYVTVHVVWMQSIEALRAVCQNPASNGCGTVGRYNGDLVTMWAIRPVSFSDEPRVCSIGHELLHNLGGTHP